MNFVFFGTSEFAVLVLESLKSSGLKPSLIISTQDKPKNRGLKIEPTPVKKWAKQNKIAVLQPEKLKSPEFIASLLDTRCSTGVVAAYGKILPKEVINIFPKGILNVHPSLLPKWRGADPVRTAILNGDEKTGVTIMLMDEEIDHGPVLAQEELKRSINNTQYSALKSELAELGGKMLVEIIPKWLSDEITPEEQDHKLATYTKKISKEDGHIDWNEPAEIILRKIRALNPWPGTFAFWEKDGKKLRIKITSARIVDHTPCGPEEKRGAVINYDGGIAVLSKDRYIVIDKIQLEGKKSQNTKDFLNGHPDIVGAVLN